MSKTAKKPAPRLSAQESSYAMMPWSCNHHPTFSEIEAYLPVTGNWEIIADIHDTRGVDAEVVAGLIAKAVNSYMPNRELIAGMLFALELCLECREGLNWAAEQEADVSVRRAKELE